MKIRMRMLGQLAATGTLVVTAACSHTLFERQIQSGRWQDAAATFEGDSVLLRNVEAMRRMARIHATPDSVTWNPERALGLLRAARTYFENEKIPEGDARLELLLQTLVRERGERRAELEQFDDSLKRSRDELVRVQGAYKEALAARAWSEDERVLLQRLVARLEADVRDREAQINALRVELEQLKAVDLSRTKKPPIPFEGGAHLPQF